MIDVEQLPNVPENLRPKKLYVDKNLTSDEEDRARSLGWEIADVRLMANDSMHDRKEAVLAWLEGHRMGSIALNRLQLESIELEMRACGLLNNKIETPKEATKLTKDDTNALLDAVKSDRAFLGTQGTKNKPRKD